MTTLKETTTTSLPNLCRRGVRSAARFTTTVLSLAALATLYYVVLTRGFTL
ncbi:hypothetical protein ACIHIX_25050 [Streptomyces sp. NPDC051913]|uniref:hypothetical protein n=1 Tax=Streptomyces sp. NPDC051913 TaxID=3365676 RepID=UPI0037D4DA21